MTNPESVPLWLAETIMLLRAKRDRLQGEYDLLEQKAEAARRACVPVQQQLSKISDALSALEHAAEWAAGTAWEVPL